MKKIRIHQYVYQCSDCGGDNDAEVVVKIRGEWVSVLTMDCPYFCQSCGIMQDDEIIMEEAEDALNEEGGSILWEWDEDVWDCL